MPYKNGKSQHNTVINIIQFESGPTECSLSHMQRKRLSEFSLFVFRISDFVFSLSAKKNINFICFEMVAATALRCSLVACHIEQSKIVKCLFRRRVTIETRIGTTEISKSLLMNLFVNNLNVCDSNAVDAYCIEFSTNIFHFV